jgi:hypothetical protein
MIYCESQIYNDDQPDLPCPYYGLVKHKGDDGADTLSRAIIVSGTCRTPRRENVGSDGTVDETLRIENSVENQY